MDEDTGLRALRREIEELTASVTRLVRALEQDDHLRERKELAESDERDRRHSILIEDIKAVHDTVEQLGASNRKLPETILRLVEREIYKLRTARWELQQQQSGVTPEGSPYGPPPALNQTGKVPAIREPTGKVPALNDETALTPGQQRVLWGAAARVWFWAKWALLPAGGALVKWLHDLWKHA